VASTRETQKKYCSRAIMLAIVFFFGCYVIGQVAIGKGFLLGAIFSILNFILMGETLRARMGTGKREAYFRSLGAILFRYGVLAVPLYVGIKYPQFNLIAIVAGVFLIQALIVFDHVVMLKRKPSKDR
jgi:hypothetical protein